MIPTSVWEATYRPRYSSGRKITLSTPSDSTTATALADVQQISDSALTAAEVLTSAPTGTPGYRCRSNRISAAVIDAASEHPAWGSGISTVFSGDRIFAVSAMKWTPASTITS